VDPVNTRGGVRVRMTQIDTVWQHWSAPQILVQEI
jgi:hypothetical protein